MSKETISEAKNMLGMRDTLVHLLEYFELTLSAQAPIYDFLHRHTLHSDEYHFSLVPIKRVTR